MSPQALVRIRQVLTAVFLEALAVFLALYQGLSGVQTDEAKYILNIPYPHPPLARTAFQMLEALPFQEMFVRIILASLLIQSVWLVAALVKKESVELRMTLCGLWLFSGSVLFQAGTIMMAPLTALQGLLFVWLYFQVESGKWKVENYSGLIALLWLGSLFTAYQAVLFAPIVCAIFWRQPISLFKKAVAVLVPLNLVVLYILTNPLAMASFTSAGAQNADLPIRTVVSQISSAWLFAGSAVLSVIGTYGLVRSKQWPLLASFLLVVAFLWVSFRDYYAILFLPLLVAGAVAHADVLKKPASLLALQIVAAVYIFSVASLAFYENNARTVMRMVNQVSAPGVVLIAGGFGHQWQFESTSPVYRYRTGLLSKAKAVVCLEQCPDVSHYGFYQVNNVGQEVWVRK